MNVSNTFRLYLLAWFLLVALDDVQPVVIKWPNDFRENVSVTDILEMYIPTMSSQQEKCRNHSLYYVQELKELKLWASEMMDATGKLPSGILYGASHDLGNFDECLELRVPYNKEEFSGKYCIAKFTVNPPKSFEKENSSVYYQTNDYAKYYNESVWKKLAAYSNDRTKGARNELYVAFCLPSSCSNSDLSSVLQDHIREQNKNTNFEVNVDINQRSCQIQETVHLDTGDILFILFLVFTVFLAFSASLYETLTNNDGMKHFLIKGKLHKVILCFSVPTNYRKLVSKSRNTEGFDCMAGMKVYSMILIIALHRLMFAFGSPMVNPKYVEELYTKFETTLLLNGPILVETFFTISGFLATYLILEQLTKSKNGVNLLTFYIHRILRMTPTYAVILAFYCTIFVKIGSGPFWQERVGLEQERCRASWWANLLYINNYVNTDKICMFQSWYMTCDMNFFWFTPVVTWVLWKKPKAGLLLVSALLVASIVVVFAIVYVNNLEAIFLLYIKVLKDPVSNNAFRTIYIPGHMRASSYFVGILAGYAKFKIKENGLKIPPMLVRIGWILCAPILIASLYTGFVFYLLKVPPLFTALYASLYHVAWSICIAWMIIAISSGYGRWVEPVLTWRPLVVLSRLTYCVYISHGAIQLFTAGTIRSPIYASVFNMEYQTAADILLAYLLAFVVSMLFESPIIGLEKVLRSKEPKKEKVVSENETSVEME